LAKHDYYEVLGITRDASAEQIKQAYRRKAKELHPDRNPNSRKRAEQEFKRAAEAYEILSDPNKRAQYDRYGHAGPAQGFDFGPTDFSRARGAFSEFGFGDFDDIFDLFFHQGGPRTATRTRQPQQGESIEYRLRITLEDAATGTKMKVTIPRMVPCKHCSGTGMEPGTKKRTCPTCGGTGQVQYRQQSLLGTFVNLRTCPECKGSGELIDTPCQRCHGTGRVKEKKKISISVPAGVDNGSRLRLRGQGNIGPGGGSPGDLYIVIEVIPHPYFERQGQDIYSKVKIHYGQAVLGTKLEVDTLWGTERITIPGGTHPGTVLRLRGKGMPDLRNHRKGNHFVKVEVIVPRQLNASQRRALEAYQKTLSPPGEYA